MHKTEAARKSVEAAMKASNDCEMMRMKAEGKYLIQEAETCVTKYI